VPDKLQKLIYQQLNHAMHSVQARFYLDEKARNTSSLTVFEMSSVLLQYNTGAAATTLVVNDPERNLVT
jgi:hypothetical protein